MYGKWRDGMMPAEFTLGRGQPVMRDRVVFLAAAFFLTCVFYSQSALAQSDDAVKQALSQGDLYASKRKYELALDAYHKADKAAHHNCALCYLKLASVERKIGDFSAALDDTKKAVKAAGDDKSLAYQAHM